MENHGVGILIAAARNGVRRRWEWGVLVVMAGLKELVSQQAHQQATVGGPKESGEPTQGGEQQ